MLHTSEIITILERRYGGTPHSGSTFFNHLYGTYRILKEDLEMPYPYNLVGLLHSIYGNEYFQDPSSAPPSREEVFSWVGGEVEYLVYLFHLPGIRGVIMETQASKVFDPVALKVLRGVMYANEIEQEERNIQDMKASVESIKKGYEGVKCDTYYSR